MHYQLCWTKIVYNIANNDWTDWVLFTLLRCVKKIVRSPTKKILNENKRRERKDKTEVSAETSPCSLILQLKTHRSPVGFFFYHNLPQVNKLQSPTTTGLLNRKDILVIWLDISMHPQPTPISPCFILEFFQIF